MRTAILGWVTLRIGNRGLLESDVEMLWGPREIEEWPDILRIPFRSLLGDVGASFSLRG